MSSLKSFCFYYWILLSFFGGWFLTYIAFLCAFDVKDLDVSDKPSHALGAFLSAGFYHLVFFSIIGHTYYKSRKNRKSFQDPNVYELLVIDH
ncbi:unnamed protein product [Blepharisma stoltei]|uniref:Uncharacterized protein n=1 Tax=Blepharisma stoltei TaxID=1481888 RepID=A0AAU9K1A5_9CILI|nr:unnamed protein product [Blepharisma stoltei]